MSTVQLESRPLSHLPYELRHPQAKVFCADFDNGNCPIVYNSHAMAAVFLWKAFWHLPNYASCRAQFMALISEARPQYSTRNLYAGLMNSDYDAALLAIKVIAEILDQKQAEGIDPWTLIGIANPNG